MIKKKTVLNQFCESSSIVISLIPTFKILKVPFNSTNFNHGARSPPVVIFNSKISKMKKKNKKITLN